jgi:hypothetical protein
MPQIPRSRRMLQKSEAALIAAIEIYNKPYFQYREETFAILALNAWELLLKAKVLEVNGNDSRSLFVYETRRRKGGASTKKQYLKRNRSGNIQTHGLGGCLTLLEKAKVDVPSHVRMNLDVITEIRDNAVHYIVASASLERRVLAVGTACVSNFVKLASGWFGAALTGYKLHLMPLGFIAEGVSGELLVASGEEKNLVDYIGKLMQESATTAAADFHVALDVKIQMRRAGKEAPIKVQIVDAPGGAKVTVSEEDIRKSFPWDYDELNRQMKKRFSNFILNNKYHAIRKAVLGAKPGLKHTRMLDPENQNSAKKDYYSPNLLREFDAHYKRRSAGA